MQPTPKQKVSLTLDADLVAAFEQGGPLSSQVNDALRAELDRRQRSAALRELADALVEVYGPLDTPEDRAAIAAYVDLLA